MATVGRDAQLERFLDSLVAQSYTNLELIVVDQNPDNRLAPFLGNHRARVPLAHVRSTLGLSRARNCGLRHITGDIVVFPDDDCWYPEGLLASVAGLLERNARWDGVTVTPLDENGRLLPRRWNRVLSPITRENVWESGTSWTIFLRRRVVEATGQFDESLGVGAPTPWQSGEETDYLIRTLDAGFRLWFEPHLAVHHPRAPSPYGPESRAKAYRYACGQGRVLRKQRYSAVWITRKYLARSAGGGLLAAATGRWQKLLLHRAVMAGLWRGLAAHVSTG